MGTHFQGVLGRARLLCSGGRPLAVCLQSGPQPASLNRHHVHFGFQGMQAAAGAAVLPLSLCQLQGKAPSASLSSGSVLFSCQHLHEAFNHCLQRLSLILDDGLGLEDTTDLLLLDLQGRSSKSCRKVQSMRACEALRRHL